MGGAFAKAAAGTGGEILKEFTSAMVGSFRIAAGIVLAAILLGLLLLGAYLLTKKK